MDRNADGPGDKSAPSSQKPAGSAPDAEKPTNDSQPTDGVPTASTAPPTSGAAAAATADIGDGGHQTEGTKNPTDDDRGASGAIVAASDASTRPLQIASRRTADSRTITVRDVVALLEHDPMYRSSTALFKLYDRLDEPH